MFEISYMQECEVMVSLSILAVCTRGAFWLSIILGLVLH